jgi:hypothetical protein
MDRASHWHRQTLVELLRTGTEVHADPTGALGLERKYDHPATPPPLPLAHDGAEGGDTPVCGRGPVPEEESRAQVTRNGATRLTRQASKRLRRAIWCRSTLEIRFAGARTRLLPVLALCWLYAYYAVDHSPCYLWNSATWEISEALIPFLATVMSGGDAWDADLTVRRAIEIRAGVVQNPKILSFQSRSSAFPYPKQ